MKTGLVLEGGAMKGMYTAGVLDVFLSKNVQFDGVIGVSAGALFGVNYLSGQTGRVIRYNKKYNKEKEYMGFQTLLKTGNIVNTEYAYERVPYKLDPFDDEAFQKSGVPFYAVVTNLRTGNPEYIRIKSVYEQMDILRASGSMPFLSTPVRFLGNDYLDGAVADSLPFQKMLDLGYDRLVVVLTKCDGYVKKPLPKSLANMYYQRRFPLFAQKVKDRHIMYNRQMQELKALEQKGIVKIIQPSEAFQIGKLERDPVKMEILYQLGRKDARHWLKEKRDWK